jgi:Protein kinase domain
MTHNLQPLTQMLAGNRLPISDTIRYALNISGALRRIHADGRCHGALTPELIQVSEGSARLTAATPGALEDLTPYTAPEVLNDEPADSRTDIFAFGAIVYEMATGRRAFLADDPEALVEEIKMQGFSSTGHEGLDQVVKSCLAKEPAARWQRMQQVQMELKLLAIAARQEESKAPERPDLEAMVRAEFDRQLNMMADLERTVANRAAELEQAVTTALQDVQTQFAEVEKVLEASQQRADHFTQSAVETAEATQREIAALQVGLAGEVHAMEQNMKAQAATVDSVKAAMSRQEDYVERVVEALEALQNVIFNQPEDLEHLHQDPPIAIAS